LENTARTLLPIILFIVAAIIYRITSIANHKQYFRHYRYCLKMARFLSLILLYASVNYFVVRELSAMLFGRSINSVSSIPGGWFFWTMTIFLPCVYIVRGLQTKDRLLLHTGILLIAATVFTVRYYYSIAPLEEVMSVAGLFMILSAYMAIKFLKSPKFGLADTEPVPGIQHDGLQLEAIIVAETLPKNPAPGSDGFQFGGGSSGGGGATGGF
jgi:hypothetical protein